MKTAIVTGELAKLLPWPCLVKRSRFYSLIKK